METWVWVVIGVIVLAIVIALIVTAMRRSKRRKEEQARRDRQLAADLRARGQSGDVEARQREAAAATARAEAAEAKLDAERLEREAEERTRKAEKVRESVAHDLQEADRLDRDARGDRHSEAQADATRAVPADERTGTGSRPVGSPQVGGDGTEMPADDVTVTDAGSNAGALPDDDAPQGRHAR